MLAGPRLDDLRLRGAATGRTATEGTTLVEVDGRTVVLASDGRRAGGALLGYGTHGDLVLMRTR